MIRSSQIRMFLSALSAMAGISCSSQQFVRVHNRSDTVLNCQRLNQPLQIAPGGSDRLALVSSQTVGLSVPLLEARARVSEKHAAIELNGIRFELPAAYLERLEAREDRSWVSQVLDSEAGDLSYRSEIDVRLLDGGYEWELRGGGE